LSISIFTIHPPEYPKSWFKEYKSYSALNSIQPRFADEGNLLSRRKRIALATAPMAYNHPKTQIRIQRSSKRQLSPQLNRECQKQMNVVGKHEKMNKGYPNQF